MLDKFFAFILAAAFMVVPCGVFASSAGFNNDVSDARALGNANAVVARADAPSANWFNPAALTRLEGSQFSVTGMVEFVNMDFDSTSGRHVKMDQGTFFVPSFFYTSHINEEFAWGIGLNSPYGLATNWKDPSTKYITTKADLKVFNINPNIAWQVSPRVSVAAGVDVIYGMGNMRKDLNQTMVNTALSGSLMPTLDGHAEMDGDTWEFGGNLALFYDINQDWNFGISWRSQVNMDLDGTVEFKSLSGPMAAVFGGTKYKTDASVKIPTPDTIAAGLSYKVTPDTVVELDVEWARWSAVNEFNIKYPGETNPVRLAILNSGNPTPRDWDDTFNVMLGVEHRLNERYSIYGGTRYRPSPVPEKTFDPIIPSCDLLSFHAGFSRHWENSRLDFVVDYVYGIKRDVNNNVGANVMTSIDGEYGSDFVAVGFTYTYKI